VCSSSSEAHTRRDDNLHRRLCCHRLAQLFKECHYVATKFVAFGMALLWAHPFKKDGRWNLENTTQWFTITNGHKRARGSDGHMTAELLPPHTFCSQSCRDERQLVPQARRQRLNVLSPSHCPARASIGRAVARTSKPDARCMSGLPNTGTVAECARWPSA